MDLGAELAQAAHVEVTCLLVSGENDSPEQVARLAKWLASIDKNIPLHLLVPYDSFSNTGRVARIF